MRYATMNVLITLFLITCVFSSGILAAVPNAGDVTVVGLGGPPGCWFEESQVLMSNASSEYDYKVQVSANATNDDNGPNRCKDGGNCEEVLCQCSLSGVYIAESGNYRDFKISCNLPQCPNCDTNCDNPDRDCEVIYHCTCAWGSYLVTHYRTTPDGQWYPMLSASWTAITKEQQPECPPGGGCS